MEYYVSKGADPTKLVMGIPTYGQAFTLHDQSSTGLNSPASKGQAGKYTRAAGFLAYNEVTLKPLGSQHKLLTFVPLSDLFESAE